MSPNKHGGENVVPRVQVAHQIVEMVAISFLFQNVMMRVDDRNIRVQNLFRALIQPKQIWIGTCI